MSNSLKNELSKSEINNEDVINNLTKDLESSFITSDKSPPSTSSNHSDNFVIEPDDKEDSLTNTSHPDFVFKNATAPTNNFDSEDFEVDHEEKNHSDNEEEDYELTLKDLESSLSISEIQDRKSEADNHKNIGNDKFKNGDYEESIIFYTKGLRICPLIYKKDRAILYSNRAASKMKLNKNKDAIKDCSKAIENDDTYIKAYYRRAQCYEQTDSLDESLADYKKILEFDSNHIESRKAIIRLPPMIEERNERMKTEMLSKLKDLGNLVLKPFGLSTDNFKLTQDPETKGYSVSFQQNK